MRVDEGGGMKKRLDLGICWYWMNRGQREATRRCQVLGYMEYSCVQMCVQIYRWCTGVYRYRWRTGVCTYHSV